MKLNNNKAYKNPVKGQKIRRIVDYDPVGNMAFVHYETGTVVKSDIANLEEISKEEIIQLIENENDNFLETHHPDWRKVIYSGDWKNYNYNPEIGKHEYTGGQEL